MTSLHPAPAAVLLDMDGVLYEGDAVVPGAPEAVSWLREHGIPLLFLTNTSSKPRSALVAKLAGLGIEAGPDDILTPPLAAVDWIRRHAPGLVALFVPDATRTDFAGVPLADDETTDVSAVVVGDLGPGWDFWTLNRAFRLLMQEHRPRLVALGLTRYWKAGDGLRLDVGPYVRALEYAAGVEAVVTGKPAAGFFQAAVERLGRPADRVVMVGDDIRGDVAAAQAVGIRGVLVHTGKFRPADLELGITPFAQLDSIARLPGWWQEQMGARA